MALCLHNRGFVVGPPDFGGPLGAQNLCCKMCGRSKRQIQEDAEFAAHNAHKVAGVPWRKDCPFCPATKP